MSMHVSYLGKAMNIVVQVDPTVKKDSLVESTDMFTLSMKTDDIDRINALIKSHYRKQLKKKIEAFVKKHQSSFKVKPRGITIESSIAKWGSCNSNRELMFNWQLMVAPVEVIEYVVIHEMCHMLHMNHDRSFWRLVGKLCPRYQEYESWLKNHGQDA